MPAINLKKQSIKRSGFTLIEMVVVIIVIAILAATAVPKFANRSGFEDYTVRDQLIARLRLVQLQNMNADPSGGDANNGWYWLVVKNGCFYHEQTLINAVPSAPDVCTNDSYNAYNAVSFPSGMLIPNNYRFDLNGKLVSGNDNILINGDNTLQVTIESEGYIHE